MARTWSALWTFMSIVSETWRPPGVIADRVLELAGRGQLGDDGLDHAGHEVVLGRPDGLDLVSPRERVDRVEQVFRWDGDP